MSSRKNKKRNAFYYFMSARKSELETQGMSFPGGLKDVSAFVSDEWQNMSIEEKKKYDRDHKLGHKNVDEPPKFANPSEEARWKQKKKMELEQARVIEIGTLVKKDHIEKMTIILIDFNIWGIGNDGNHVPAEIALIAFSLSGGIIDNYGTVVDPRKIDLGMGFDVIIAAEELDLPVPPFDYVEDGANVKYVLNCIFWFINKHKDSFHPGYVFCRQDRMDIVHGCLNWLCKQADVNHKFVLYPFEHLLVKMAQVNTEKPTEESIEPVPCSSKLSNVTLTSSEVHVEPVSSLVNTVENEEDIPSPIQPESSKEMKSPVETSKIPSVTEEESCSSQMTKLLEGISSVNLKDYSFKFFKEFPPMSPQELQLQKWKRVQSDEPPTLTDEERAYNWQLLQPPVPDPLDEVRVVLNRVSLMKNWYMSHKCALSRLNRYAYYTFEYLLPKFGMEAVASCHYSVEEMVKHEVVVHTLMLKNWGLEERNYRTYMAPTQRLDMVDSDSAVMLARTFYTGDLKLEQLPVYMVPPLWRPKPPSPTFTLVDSKIIKKKK